MKYERCELCGERGNDDNPTFESDGKVKCYECEQEGT